MKLRQRLFFILAIFLLSSCGPQKSDEATDDDEAMIMEEDNNMSGTNKAMEEAKATIGSASESELTGEATFTDLGEGKVTFKLTIKNATPGTHAIHLHENGDCSAADATSAGGHWNPANVEHGKRTVDMKYHAGDIDNIEVGDDGTGTLTMTVTGWSVGGADSTNIVNKAIIIHAAADDFKSQPSGAAGKRVGCGTIELVQ